VLNKRNKPSVKAAAGARAIAQKRRTKAALLAAAARLVAAGKSPTVTEVADAANVSRRTAYRHFPTQEQLLVEGALEGLRPEVELAIASVLPADTSQLDDDKRAELQLDALLKVMHRTALENEPLLRTMIRLTAGRPAGSRPVRGSRRVDWLTSAVLPVKQRLGAKGFDLLISALTSCVGMDSLFVLQDTRGLSAAAAERVTRWTARALLAAAIAEAKAAHTYPSKRALRSMRE
jgi:AcrR family transcriptional regulator